MLSAPHRVARLQFTASVADLDLAFGLRSRIERLAWEMLPAAIARVFDEIGPADQQLRVARIDLDLGTVRPETLEEDAIDALQRALTDALADVLHRARYSPSDDARLVDPAATWLEDFDHFLGSGRLPVARRDAGFDAVERLLWLIAEQPEALTDLLVRRARDRHVLERLVLQVGDDGFRALLVLLAPRDAAVILALVADVMLVHCDPPVAIPSALRAPALERVLRVATLEFLLRDPGTQFNRRRFLAHLLRREARAMGVDYGVLLRLLGDAVGALRAHQGLGGSLPQTLSELLAEPGIQGSPAASEGVYVDAAITAARVGNYDALLASVRRAAGDHAALLALVGRLSAELFAGLVERLDPANAALILAMLDDLSLVHRADRALRFDGFEPALRALTLTYLVRDPGTQFNRRQFLAFLIAREAERAQIGYRDLVRLFADALARLRSHQGLRGSLPLVLAELVEEAGQGRDEMADGAVRAAVRHGDVAALLGALTSRAHDPEALIALLRHLPAPVFERLVRRMRPASAATILKLLAQLVARPLAFASQAELTAWVRAAGLGWLLRAPQRRFDRRAWLNAVIAELAARGGADEATLHAILAAPDRGAGEGEVTALLRRIDAGENPATLLASLRELARDPVRLARLAMQIDPDGRARLFASLDPRGAPALQASLQRFAARHAERPLLDLDAAAFERLLWTLALRWQAGQGGAAFDEAAFAQAIVEGIARFGGKRVEDVAAAMVREPARPSPSDPQRLLDQYLRGGAPRGAGRGLPAMLAADPRWLATAIRRQGRSAPAHRPAMIDRLLRWLTPDELVECLAPGLGARALRWADATGGVDAAQWQTMIAALLDGDPSPFVALPGVAGRRLDRIALLGHWLDHSATPWWSRDGEALEAALAALPQASFAELDRLFGADGFARLWRVIAAADPALQSALFDRLIPWATRPRSALAAVLNGLAPRDRLLALTRAAADALAGVEPDLARLASPVTEPPPHVAEPSSPPNVAAIDTARLLAWLDGGAARAVERGALVRHFAALADRDDPALIAWFDARRGDSRARARWAGLLPPEALARLVRLLVPGGAQLWLDAVAMLGVAARRSATFGTPVPDPVQLWTLMLDLVATRDPPAPVAGVALLVEQLAAGDAERADRLRRDALRLAQDGGHRAAAAALRRAAPLDPPVAPPPRASLSSPPAPSDDEDDAIMPPETDDAIFIGNAGLILFGPYLPALFDRLGLLSETDQGPRIVDAEAMSRGVHLLQYLVDERCDAPEPELVLNKLLCGLPTAQPIAASIEPGEADIAICDGLIAAVIANWPILGKASPAALRETFLQREGRLTHGADRWDLRVQRKTVDVLVDQVPWNIAMLYHRWMREAVHVTW
ncbi:MAG: contractile injection system tape measure protein [Sphingomonas sp.]